jgi:hypothetical protein
MRTLRLPERPRKRGAKASDPRLPFGSSFCKCSECGEYFKSASAFERHRIGEFGLDGDRGCAPTARMPELGLKCTDGIWHFPRRAFLDDRRQYLRALEAAA